jgi:hypothetical protein
MAKTYSFKTPKNVAKETFLLKKFTEHTYVMGINSGDLVQNSKKKTQVHNYGKNAVLRHFY